MIPEQRAARQQSDAAFFAEEARRLWDAQIVSEAAASKRGEFLRLEAERTVFTRNPGLRSRDPERYEALVWSTEQSLVEKDRVRNTHIGDSQWHRSKGTFAALMALLYSSEEKPRGGTQWLM